MDKTFSPSYSSSQIIYVEAEALQFSRFRFHRKMTASTASASSFRFRFHISVAKAALFSHETRLRRAESYSVTL